MPESPPSPSPVAQVAAHPAVTIAQMLFQFLTMVVVMYTANLGNRNHDKIERVESRQEQAADQAADAINQTKAVKKAVERKSETDTEATAIQLWSAWKYLESVYEASGKEDDRAKAEEAKLVYDDYMRKRK